LCAQLLKGSGVKVCTVIGFPLGANDPAVKAFEAAKAVENGADEVDMVRIAFVLFGARNTITLAVQAVLKSMMTLSPGALLGLAQPPQSPQFRLKAKPRAHIYYSAFVLGIL
jgi:deoxyribose-phosphate aldolase